MQKKKTKFSLTSFFTGYDKPLALAIVFLALFGLVAILNASSVGAYRDFADQYHYVKDQAVFLVVGLFLMWLVSQIDYRIWYKLAVPLLSILLVLLIAVFIPGIGVKALGAKRWINFGFFVLQPTELAKLVLIIYLSAWFTHQEKGRFVPFIVLLGIVIGLIILQPDLGTAIIISGIAGMMYFVSGVPLANFLLLLPLGIGGIALLAISAPYRLQRLLTFLNPDKDPLGTSYHVRQILIALGAGGLFGVGLGKSRQKYEYLPEATTDSIFAIIAEEIGFLGCILLISVFALCIWRIFKIAQSAPDRFGRMLTVGIGGWFGIQTVINLSAMVSLVPLTGVPLPFISYGGSNLISLLIGFGILLNVGKQREAKRTLVKRK